MIIINLNKLLYILYLAKINYNIILQIQLSISSYKYSIVNTHVQASRCFPNNYILLKKPSLFIVYLMR